jgi:ABC-2 type transport system ATP-binding protein
MTKNRTEPKLLEVNNIVKRYGDLNAVNDISFSIGKGICFGLLGPNGAGKTTALEAIENITPIDSGEILYKGKKRSRQFKEEIGIQFQATELLGMLTVSETLKTFKALYSKTQDFENLMSLCNLEDIKNNRNDKLSGGQKQRLLLAVALVNSPALLFLDEPSTGMDPQARRNMWDIIDSIKSSGKTVILTTHYMEEAQYLCDEIAIMDNGKIIAQGSPKELIQKHCDKSAIILPEDIIPELDSIKFEYLKINGNIEILTEDINSSIKELIANGISLNHMSVRSPNLEDVFLTLTGKKLRE